MASLDQRAGVLLGFAGILVGVILRGPADLNLLNIVAIGSCGSCCAHRRVECLAASERMAQRRPAKRRSPRPTQRREPPSPPTRA